jgi:hypothetical protein
VKPSIGDRVRVTGILPGDPDPLPIGAEGTVDWVNQWTDYLTRQFGVKWDNGRTLMLLGSDPFVIL